MKGRKKGGKSSPNKDHNIKDQSTESTGTASGVSSAYGMPKAPRQKMAGAAKKAAQKVRRASGANYAGSSGG